MSDGTRANSTDKEVQVEDMALYTLDRVKNALDKLGDRDNWTLQDIDIPGTCMHYYGDAAIDLAAKQLRLQAGGRVVDIGSGFSRTGRYLNQEYGVKVTGVELQKDIHDLAQLMTSKTGQKDDVISVNGVFLTAEIPGTPFSHMVSFLCILHIPDRSKLFSKAASSLEKGATVYIEDYFRKGNALSPDISTKLRNYVSCPCLPSREEYINHLEQAGFVDIQFDDVTESWTVFVEQRASAYAAQE